MIPRALRGLRGRLLLALVATSAVTLAVAAAVTLSPLQKRLRDQSQTSLQTAMFDSLPNLESRYLSPPAHGADARAARFKKAIEDIAGPAADLSLRTGARVLVGDTTLTPPGVDPPAFLYDSSVGAPDQDTLRLALLAMQYDTTETEFVDNGLTIATPLNDRNGQLIGVLVAERQLTEVSNAVHLVRNALLAAAAIGLAVAIGLGITLSSTLTRRLDRLRRAALRITKEGPEAPAPHDTGRDEVGDLGRALVRMQEELRRQETARRSFVSTASHELRTPLTMLQGTMELLDEDLREGLDLEDAQEQVANARRELRRLSALASELLDLSRLDAAVQLRSEPVELSELTRAVAAEFSLRAHDRAVPIEVVPPPEPCWAKADPAACARIVRILIDNALRYAPRGEPITVVTERLGSRAIVEVADRGPGVPPEERERIFERFHRGRGAGAESGFGLGLAIGRELAERMNGALLLEDADVGACFQLALPATTASSPSPEPAPGSAAAA
jgi:signal transduction histidine kinase